mmetsp:Transcript_12847/g.23154  ORF Transcript_12847/g.23154 Transcript_12847/m.23154 type:complete len:96 (-) Transcript_12847:2352-2639(-)
MHLPVMLYTPILLPYTLPIPTNPSITTLPPWMCIVPPPSPSMSYPFFPGGTVTVHFSWATSGPKRHLAVRGRARTCQQAHALSHTQTHKVAYTPE